mmetsp:Transcript_65051/g.188628  ORF Transcript_65051/g.188628 Transcript_65051/m.188628 type:complete len:250 (-) Transcript_65051:1407-2156(-)
MRHRYGPAATRGGWRRRRRFSGSRRELARRPRHEHATGQKALQGRGLGAPEAGVERTDVLELRPPRLLRLPDDGQAGAGGPRAGGLHVAAAAAHQGRLEEGLPRGQQGVRKARGREARAEELAPRPRRRGEHVAGICNLVQVQAPEHRQVVRHLAHALLHRVALGVRRLDDAFGTPLVAARSRAASSRGLGDRGAGCFRARILPLPRRRAPRREASERRHAPPGGPPPPEPRSQARGLRDGLGGGRAGH